MDHTCIIEGFLPDSGRSLNVTVKQGSSVCTIKQLIYSEKLIHPERYYLTNNGKCLNDNDVISWIPGRFTVLKSYPFVYGGKGGFGTLIRAMGTQANKGARKGACRDLSGRRMRDVDAEKKLAEWVAEEPERNRKRMESKEKKRQQRRSEPKHYFNDSSYVDQIRGNEGNIDIALQQGMEAATSSKVNQRGTKRKSPQSSTGNAIKKQKIWLGVDDESISSDDESISSDDEPECVSKEDDTTSDTTNIMSTAIPSKNNEETSKILSLEVVKTNSPASESVVIDSPEDLKTKSKEPSSTNEILLKTIDLDQVTSVEDLLSLGGDQLKYTLQSMGLKCGGTIEERAERLYSTKGKKMDEIDQSLFSKGGKRKRICAAK